MEISAVNLLTFRPKFCTQHSVEMAAKIPHVRCRPKFCMQSSAEISAENMHSLFCSDFNQKMHAEFCRNFGRNSARRVHLRMQPKFRTRRFRPKYLQNSKGIIWAKSLQNSALRISSQLSAQFSLQNFGQNGCRIVDADFLPSSAFTQQICGCRALLSRNNCGSFYRIFTLKTNRSGLGICTEVDLKLPPIYCRDAGTFCEEAAKL